MVITLCSLPVKILITIVLVIGLLHLEFHNVNILILEEIDLLSRSQALDEASMSLESYFVVVSNQFSDTEDRSLYSHTVKSNCNLGPICYAFSMD